LKKKGLDDDSDKKGGKVTPTPWGTRGEAKLSGVTSPKRRE